MNKELHIVFQAYGSEQNLQECLYALLSFSRVHTTLPEAWKIHIYTDQPGWFDQQQTDLSLELHLMDQNLLRQWRGEINFVHRVKIALLQDLAAQVQGSILYLDSDICFLRPVTELAIRLEAGELFMHIAEGRPSEEPNPILRKLNRFLKQQGAISIAGQQQKIDPRTTMWNAGVLGFPVHKAALLQQVMEVTDTIYPRFPKHVVEQFAFSCMMQQAGAVHSAAPYILHYWNFKEFRLYLASFFAYYSDKRWTEQVRLSDLLPIAALIQEKLGFYRNRSIADKIRGKHFVPVLPDWSAAAGQL